MATQIATLGKDHLTNIAFVRLQLGVLPKVVFKVARSVKNFTAVLVDALEPEVLPSCLGIYYPVSSKPLIRNLREGGLLSILRPRGGGLSCVLTSLFLTSLYQRGNSGFCGLGRLFITVLGLDLLADWGMRCLNLLTLKLGLLYK